MKRLFLLVVCSVVLVGALYLAGDRSLRAQSPPASLPAGLFGDTPKETEALALADSGSLLTARRLADEILAEDPSSIIGHYVVGRALFVEEGSLPNALFHFQKALSLYEARYPVPSNGASLPWRLHSRLLLNISWVAHAMEDYDEQFKALDQYDLLYVPKRIVDRAWPLMKMKKFEEARAAAQTGLESENKSQISQALNALCAIAGEEKNRQRGYDDCLNAYQNSLARYKADPSDLDAAGDVVVDGHNAAWGASGLLRFEETERYLTEASKVQIAIGTNPWQGLAELYTEQGRLSEAVAAMQAMIKWKNNSPPSSRDQRRASLDSTLAATLLVAGEPILGIRVASRALEHPDRRANTSSDAEQALGGAALLRRALSLSYAEMVAEEASAEGFWSGSLDKARASWIQALVLPDEERVIGVLTDEERLLSTFRLYLAGGISIPVWLAGDLVPLVGPGVAFVVLQEVRALESLPELLPYYDALEGEIAFHQGDFTEAVRLSKKALAGLAPKQRLIRARAAAIGAEAAKRLSDLSTALDLYSQAMQQDPGAVRRLGFSLPVVIQNLSPNEVTNQVAERLQGSPRFYAAAQGFLITIVSSGDSAKICLDTPQGTQLSCATGETQNKESQEEPAVRALKAFHKSAFSAPLGDALADLRSLDGTTTAADEATRKKTQSILEEIAK